MKTEEFDKKQIQRIKEIRGRSTLFFGKYEGLKEKLEEIEDIIEHCKIMVGENLRKGCSKEFVTQVFWYIRKEYNDEQWELSDDYEYKSYPGEKFTIRIYNEDLEPIPFMDMVIELESIINKSGDFVVCDKINFNYEEIILICCDK